MSDYETIDEPEGRRVIHNRYGDFELSRGIVPLCHKFGLRQGYCYDRSGSTPMLVAMASLPSLLPLFYEMLAQLSGEVQVLLEEDHAPPLRPAESEARKWLREDIESTVLLSVLQDYEELLQHDGGTAIRAFAGDVEVMLDDHKQLIVFVEQHCQLRPFARLLESFKIPLIRDFEYISMHSHAHATDDVFCRQFEQLVSQLGAELYEHDEDDDG